MLCSLLISLWCIYRYIWRRQRQHQLWPLPAPPPCQDPTAQLSSPRNEKPRHRVSLCVQFPPFHLRQVFHDPYRRCVSPPKITWNELLLAFSGCISSGPLCAARAGKTTRLREFDPQAFRDHESSCLHCAGLQEQNEAGQDKVQGSQFKALKAKEVKKPSQDSRKSQGEKFRALKAKEAAKRAARLGAQVKSLLGRKVGLCSWASWCFTRPDISEDSRDDAPTSKILCDSSQECYTFWTILWWSQCQATFFLSHRRQLAEARQPQRLNILNASVFDGIEGKRNEIALSEEHDFMFSILQPIASATGNPT